MKIVYQHKLKLLYGKAYVAQLDGTKCLAYELIPTEALNEDLEVEVDIQSPYLRSYIQMIPSHNAQKDYLAFQYVEGETLAQIIQKKQLLSEDQLIKLIKAVLNGLKTLHSHSTLGRCFQPSTIILTPQQQIVLMEIGFTPQFNIDIQDNLIPNDLKSKQYGLPIDMWQIGLLAWQLMHMKLIDESTQMNIDARLKKVYSKELILLVENMLQLDPSLRLTFIQLFESNIFQEPQFLNFYQQEVNHEEIFQRVRRVEGCDNLLTQTIQIPNHLLRHSQFSKSQFGQSQFGQSQYNQDQINKQDSTNKLQSSYKQENQLVTSNKQDNKLNFSYQQDNELDPLNKQDNQLVTSNKQDNKLNSSYKKNIESDPLNKYDNKFEFSNKQENKLESPNKQDSRLPPRPISKTENSIISPSNQQIRDSILQVQQKLPLQQALSKESVFLNYSVPATEIPLGQSQFTPPIYQNTNQFNSQLQEQPSNQVNQFNSINQKDKSSDNLFDQNSRSLQPPSLSKISSISSMYSNDISDTRKSLFQDMRTNLSSILDVPFAITEYQFSDIEPPIEIELYRLAFLKRCIQELPPFIDHQPLLQVSQYYLMKARIIYGLQFLRNLKFNAYNVQTQRWISYTQQSTNYMSIITQLPKILENDQRDLKVLYQNAIQNLQMLQKNPQFDDVILKITPEVQDENFEAIKTPYRKIISTLFMSILNKLNEAKPDPQLFRVAFKVLCAHLINRVFDQNFTPQHFQLIQNKYGKINPNPTTIECFINQATQTEITNQINELMSSYFQ